MSEAQTTESKEATELPEFQDVVLAFLDVLGFSARVQRLGLSEVYQQYQDVIALTQQRTEGRVIISSMPTGDGGLAFVGGYRTLSHAYFSDTILLWVKHETFVMESFLDSVLQFFCEALARQIPIRGCIAFGKAAMDRSRGIFLGEPIIEGYRGESAQKWLGISFAPSLQQPPFGWVGSLHHVIPFSRHLKPGLEALVVPLVLDWPRRWRDDYASRVGADAATQLSRMDVEPRFAEYYSNATRLVEVSEQGEAWWESANPQSLSISFGGHFASPREYSQRGTKGESA